MNDKKLFFVIMCIMLLAGIAVAIMFSFFNHPDFGHPERVFGWVEVLPETADDISMND